MTVEKELLVRWSTPRIDDQTIVTLWNNGGLTTRELAERFGVSKTRIVKGLQRSGISRKATGGIYASI
jgi:hypothetical protein